MDTQQYEEVIDKLFYLIEEQHKLMIESERRESATQAMVDKLSNTVSKIVEYNINESRLYDKHLSRLEEYRNAVSERCNRLLEHNNILLEHNDELVHLMNERDKEIEKVRERYDRVMDILESSILSGRSQGSAANITFAGKESLETLKSL